MIKRNEIRMQLYIPFDGSYSTIVNFHQNFMIMYAGNPFAYGPDANFWWDATLVQSNRKDHTYCSSSINSKSTCAWRMDGRMWTSPGDENWDSQRPAL